MSKEEEVVVVPEEGKDKAHGDVVTIESLTSSAGVDQTDLLLGGSLVSNTTSLTIVAHGKNLYGTAIYRVMSRSQAVIGNIEVKEGFQSARFRGRCSQPVMWTDGGLYRAIEPMTVYGYYTSKKESGGREELLKELAVLGKGHSMHMGENRVIEFRYSSKIHEEEDDLVIDIIDCLNGKSKVIGNITQDGRNVTASFVTADVTTNLFKGLILMYALKVYYTVYMVHKHTSPLTIINHDPPAPCPAPSLDFLSDMGSVVFRVCCIGRNGHRFIEILRAENNAHYIVMEIIEKDVQRVLFKNVFGKLQFWYDDSKENNVVVYTHMDKEVGQLSEKQCDWSFYDACNSSHTVMNTTSSMSNKYASRQDMIRKVSKKNFSVYNVSDVLLASIEIDEERNLKVDVCQKGICVQHKALLLSLAGRLAMKYYQMFNVHAPLVDMYAYRSSK